MENENILGNRLPGSWLSRLWSKLQFVLCLIVIVFVLYYLIYNSEKHSSTQMGGIVSHEVHVRTAGPMRIYIKEDCPLCQNLQTTVVESATITAPVVVVTGTVVAALRPGNANVVDQTSPTTDGKPGWRWGENDYWQFNSPELLTAFTDWEKSLADIAFSEDQLALVKELAQTQQESAAALVERLEKLVKAGTDPPKDLADAQAALIQTEIECRKEVYETETELRLARREEIALARQLEQAGLEPTILASKVPGCDIIVADVPEAMASLVKIGQGCEVRFFGVPDVVFSGKVFSIIPVLSKERHSLRVLFDISDLNDLLRPGMFAEVGLGTDERTALLVPDQSVVHIGRSDYLLVKEDAEHWVVTPVKVGEVRDRAVEILSGIIQGQSVAGGPGVILLKPIMFSAITQTGEGGK